MSHSTLHARELPFPIRYAREVYAYRHLAMNLVSSDLRTRFRRTYLGVLWAVLQPLAFSLVVAFVWGTVFRNQTYWEYAVYLYSGIIVWEYFISQTVVAQESLLRASGYLQQIRIPFLLFQIRQPLVSLVILACGLVGLFVLLAALGKFPVVGYSLLYVPAFFVLIFMFGAPIAIIMSLVGTQYRDIKYISQILTQALFFVSPVMLGRDVLANPKLAFMEYANPVIPLLDLFREPLLMGHGWPMQPFVIILAWTCALWILAIFMSARAGRKVVFSL